MTRSISHLEGDDRHNPKFQLASGRNDLILSYRFINGRAVAASSGLPSAQRTGLRSAGLTARVMSPFSPAAATALSVMLRDVCD